MSNKRAQSNLSIAAIVLGLLAVVVVALWLGAALVGTQSHVMQGSTPVVEVSVRSLSETEPVSSSAPDESTDETSAADGAAQIPQEPVAVIAWQPSHQGDTGFDGWREYEICGDIMVRAIALLGEFEHVEAWTLEHGLTGRNSYRPNPTNTAAFDFEIALANSAEADVFISLHNDGGAPSGVLGMCMPGDTTSRAFGELAVRHLSAGTGLPNRGIREEQLYSIEPDKNHTPIRFLLEIGDNVADRDYLESPDGRQTIAEAIAAAVREWEW